MSKKINYFEIMENSLYNVIVPRTALYDKSAADMCIKPTVIDNEGNLVTIEEEMVRSAVSILAMIEMDKKGYRIALVNKKLVSEIVDTVYNHITVCLDVKRSNPFSEYTVPEEDLIDMENFMLKIIDANPGTLVLDYTDKMLTRSKKLGMRSRFDDPIEVHNNLDKESPSEKFKRVSTDDNISYSDILKMQF